MSRSCLPEVADADKAWFPQQGYTSFDTERKVLQNLTQNDWESIGTKMQAKHLHVAYLAWFDFPGWHAGSVCIALLPILTIFVFCSVTAGSGWAYAQDGGFRNSLARVALQSAD